MKASTAGIWRISCATATPTIKNSTPSGKSHKVLNQFLPKRMRGITPHCCGIHALSRMRSSACVSVASNSSVVATNFDCSVMLFLLTLGEGSLAYQPEGARSLLGGRSESGVSNDPPASGDHPYHRDLPLRSQLR